MAGNPIASLFAELGFKYNDAKLKKFKSDLEGTAKQINSSSKKSVGGATKEAQKTQSEFAKQIKQNYTSKVKPSLMQMKRDLGGLDEALKQNKISQEDYAKYRRRVIEEIGKLEKQKEAAHQRALKETAAEQKRNDNQREAANKKRLNENFRINKQFDSRSAKLKQMRADFAHMNREYKAGNITLKERERILKGIVAQRARLMGPDPEPGPYAGGKDPRQAGNHRLISAIHSDVGLGVMAGGFALAQSSRAYQGVIAMEQGLAAATGSFEKGAAEMEYLIELSQRLGLFVGDLGEDYAKFAASARDTNLTAKDQREVFKGVAAQVKILNLSAADSKRIFRALSQMMSSGQIMAQELKLQMGDQLPGAMRAMARAAHNLGITQDDSITSMNKAMEAGLLLSEEVLPEFSKELWEAANQGGALEEAMKSTNAAFGRFQTNVWLANKTFQEAGMDKGIRDLTNTTSDFIRRADEIWTVLGKAGPALFVPFRALFELLGSLSDRMGILGDVAQSNEQKIKALGLIVASLFRWSRKLLATFLLIPAAMSGVAKLIDGEMLTWQEWALTLAGIAASLPIILKVLRGIKNLGGVAGAMMPKGSASGTGATAQVSEEAKRSAQRVSRLGADWQSSRGTIWNRAIESAKEAARKGAKGGPGFLPIGAGSVLPEEEFVRRQNDVPWWDLIGKLEQRQQEMNQQAIIGDITFNINGDDSRGIADEVLKTIQNMHREASINDMPQEK